MGMTRQFIRYAVVGLVSNGILYLAYIVLTWFGLGHKLAMTLLYAVGVLQTFIFNKTWTFKHEGEATMSLLRYCLSYAFGYIVNLSALIFLVDMAGYPHQIIQGIMIILIAVMLFVLQKYWVFRPQSPILSADTFDAGRPK